MKADAQKALANFTATAELAKTSAQLDELEVSWCFVPSPLLPLPSPPPLTCCCDFIRGTLRSVCTRGCMVGSGGNAGFRVTLLLWWQARVPELEAKAAKLANKTVDTGLFGWWEQNQASNYRRIGTNFSCI